MSTKRVRFSSTVSTREYTPDRQRRSARLRPKIIAANKKRRARLHACEVEIQMEKNGADEMCNEELRKLERDWLIMFRSQQLPDHEITERMAELAKNFIERMDRVCERWATNHRRKCDRRI